MPQNAISVKLGGAAGQGVESSGAGFARALARGGLHVSAIQDYMSRIRGGYNFFHVTVSDEQLFAHSDKLHILIALTADAVDNHLEELVQGGAVLYDSELEGIQADAVAAAGAVAMPVPLKQFATELGGNEIMTNTAAVGAAASLLGLDFQFIRGVIEDNFSAKGESIVEANSTVARAAYEHMTESYAPDFEHKLPQVEPAERMVLHGNAALSFGAFASGCRFVSGYPMTPATTVMEWFAARSVDYPVVVKQTEDELAGILFAVGAAHTGARSMVATSGGGFSLMVETLGLAGITETPVVMVEAQRGGPSTGLPTRTEQSDLLFVVNAGHGEFPRFVLAPTTVKQAFEDGFRAHNLAEKYQVPVIVLTDQALATRLRTVEPEEFELQQKELERGKLLTSDELDELEDYKRHELTPDGISPRAVPGHPNAVYITTGNEHDEYGYVTEESEMRSAQMEKRMRKQESMAGEVIGPECYGPDDAELTLLGWGSTYGALRTACDYLNRADDVPSVRLVQLRDIWPFPVDEAKAALGESRQIVAVEENYSGQLARLLREQTGIEVQARINKYDGRPFSPQELVGRLREEVLSNG